VTKTSRNSLQKVGNNTSQQKKYNFSFNFLAFDIENTKRFFKMTKRMGLRKRKACKQLTKGKTTKESTCLYQD